MGLKVDISEPEDMQLSYLRGRLEAKGIKASREPELLDQLQKTIAIIALGTGKSFDDILNDILKDCTDRTDKRLPQ